MGKASRKKRQLSSTDDLTLKLMVDKPVVTNNIRVFDKMCTELSPYMTELEVDQVVSFMLEIQHSKWDINPTVDDSKTQLQLILGSDRFAQICKQWNRKNQKWLTVFGTRKYKHKVDGTYWDGLDPEDNEDDYEIVWI
jgi:hypothetical protein